MYCNFFLLIFALIITFLQGTLLVYKFENDKIDLFLTLKGFSKKTINQVNSNSTKIVPNYNND